MKIALIGCMVFARDISYLIYNSKHTIHPIWLEQGLHDTPQRLNEMLQKKIDEIEAINDAKTNTPPFDAIVLAYGLCSNGIIGLSSKKFPLIAPRCDDCMALFLGSQQKYLDIFSTVKGIYWFNKPWCENAFIPIKEKYDEMRERYIEEYGEDNADFLMETEMSFTKNYENAYFIKSSIYNDSIERIKVSENAASFGWKYTEISGDNTFIEDLLNGNWDDRFLVSKPNQKIIAEYSGKKIDAQ